MSIFKGKSENGPVQHTTLSESMGNAESRALVRLACLARAFDAEAAEGGEVPVVLKAMRVQEDDDEPRFINSRPT